MSGGSFGERLRNLGKQVPALRRGAHAYRTARALERSLGGDLRYDADDVNRHEIIDRKHFMRRCFTYLAFNGIPGDYAEFGCNGAMTFRMAWSASRLVGRPTLLWGFDSFEGLPPGTGARDAHPQWVAGTMATSEDEFRSLCGEHGMAETDYRVVRGFYRESLAHDTPGERPDQVALAYVDCDLYSSTVDVLRFLHPRIGPGTLLAFDDWFCPSSTEASGERMATEEVLGDDATWRLLPYQPYGWHGMSFVVEPRS